MVQGGWVGCKRVAGHFRTVPGEPARCLLAVVKSVTGRQVAGRAGDRPPRGGRTTAQPWMNCIWVPASSIRSPLARGAVSLISGTPLMLGRLAPSTWAST